MLILVFFPLILLNLPVVFSQIFHSRHQHRHKEIINNETLHCLEIKEQLFHSTNSIDIQRIQWERFLPVFVKTQIFDLQREKNPTGSWEMEFANNYDHGRFHLLGPTGPRCKTPLESYGKGDDEKRACGLQQLQTINQVALAEGAKHECVIYSIGSGNSWGFEEAIVKQTNCRIETFDCTLSKGYKVPSHLVKRVTFHDICLGDSDYDSHGRRFVSWPTLNKITGVPNQPSFLKLDIEGYEFPVLKSIIDSGEKLPLQIAVEVHYERLINGQIEWRKANSMEVYAFINYVYKFGGYYLIDRHDNIACKHCTEIVLAKLNCENYPKPENFVELLLNPENPQDARFEKAVRQSLNTTYYS